MQSEEIRKRFLDFFEKRGHSIIPSASLVPENDPSVLFTTAGMQQFKQYYTHPKDAEKDFGSLNVVSVQKCIRTGDIEEVGDSSHLTFFEMLGNFSFGGYGRKEAIEYAYEFITKEMRLEISYVTFYKGNDTNVPKDQESEEIWKKLGIKNIKEEGEDVFWGPTGDSGPCGPTTEIYCKNAKGEDVEIWNIVFNEYFCDSSREKLDKGEAKLTKLPILGIDTGMGLERLVSVVQKKESVYDTDLFQDLIFKIEGLSTIKNVALERIVADHKRTAMFMIADGVVPSNTDRGYVLRKLIRRAIRSANPLAMNNDDSMFVELIGKKYGNFYPIIDKNKNLIIKELEKESKKFVESEKLGLKKISDLFKNEGDINTFGLNDDVLFDLYQSNGFPVELSFEEINKERFNRGLPLMDEILKKQYIERFNKKMEEHQKLSRTASVGMFKGGLTNHEENTVKLHTAHHLLLAGLQAVIGKNVKQKGSNINEERLRMDFICDHKLTDDEKKKVEDFVNEKIKEGLSMVHKEIPKVEAEKLGAEMEFGAKYPDMVSVYFIEDDKGNIISKEFCGGPHVSNTKELGHFKIIKEEAVSAGVRRIKAILE